MKGVGRGEWEDLEEVEELKGKKDFGEGERFGGKGVNEGKGRGKKCLGRRKGCGKKSKRKGKCWGRSFGADHRLGRRP